MIGSLRGNIIELLPGELLLEVHGVGYRVQASSGTLSELSRDEEVFLYTHDHIREEARDVYGFLNREELLLFTRLISISGVGPKVALSILSLGNASTVKKAIMNADLVLLTSIPGVGKKIAQKIILELKGQLVDDDVAPGPDKEVVEALVSLGYSASQAKEALVSVDGSITDVSERVRDALRNLSS